MGTASPNTILRLAAAQSSTFFRPSPHFLVTATAKQLGNWARQSPANETELANRLEDGIDGLLDLVLQHCGLTMERIRQLHLQRFSIINPVYNGTKAWIHFWSMALRVQLKDSSVKVIEIAPPTVATDLHREREDPDDNKKDKNKAALSVEEFTEETIGKWKNGDEMIGAGVAADIVSSWEGSMGKVFEEKTA